MKHSDARHKKTGTLMYGNTQLWSRLYRSADVCAPAHSPLKRHMHTHVTADMRSLSYHFAMVLIYDLKMASRVYTAKCLEVKARTNGGLIHRTTIWLLISALCKKVQQKVVQHGRDVSLALMGRL